MDQQWQNPAGRTCLVGDVLRAIDFAQRNADVSGWTVGLSERRGTEVSGRSGHRWTVLVDYISFIT